MNKKIIILFMLLGLILNILACDGLDYEINVFMINPKPIDNNLTYSGDYFDITFLPIVREIGILSIEVKEFVILFENKMESTVKIIWDQSIFIDTDNMSSRLVPGDMRMLDINQPAINSLVPSASKLNKPVIPRDNISWSDGVRISPIIRIINDKDVDKYQEAIFSIILAIEKEGELKEYRFDFKTLISAS